MTEITCPNCTSAADVGANPTNFADAYYCQNCKKPFNPVALPCPSCETDDPVGRNPFEDPFEYYCYDCDMAFNRLGATFAPNDIEYEQLESGFESPAKRLTLTAEETTKTAPPRRFECTLQNTGQEPVIVQGRHPIAVQYRVTDTEWWTIYGNPEGYSPTERVELPPGDELDWELLFSRTSIEGPGFILDQRLNRNQRFTSGTYRVVYWGIPGASVTLAAQLKVNIE